MTTEKQIEANKENALVSTGPVTDEGKAIVSQNAVKHGIFAKDLIIAAGDGKEDAQEYKELLDGLIVSLHPAGQMECILVEKIAVDFWRLRRVLRFETGSIRKFLDMAIANYYSKLDYDDKKQNRSNEQIEEDITQQQSFIDWNNRYIKALEKGVVTFNEPTWTGEGLESDIEDDLFLIAEEVHEKMFSADEFLEYEEGKLGHAELLAIFRRAGNTDKDIAEELVKAIKKQSNGYEKNIEGFRQEKLKNTLAEEWAVRIHSLPAGDTYEKVIKYEKAIQRSLLQNIALLKRIQTMN